MERWEKGSVEKMTQEVVEALGDDDESGDESSISSTSVLLTARDKEAFVHLAMTRYLTTAQLAQLLFADVSDSIPRRRLGRLAKANYLRRVPYRDNSGEPALAWTFEPAGYLAARRVYSALPPVPTYQVKPDQLEHDLMLNSLYVSLAMAARAKQLPLDRRPFRWTPSAAARRPWREYDRTSGRHESRMLLPDAILEFSGPKRRVFIEAETGSHTLGFRTDTESRGSTKSKIERYTKYVVDLASTDGGDTFYKAAFPDGWSPELLFVVPSVVRRDAIHDFLNREWRPVNEGVSLTVRAITFDDAGVDLARLCGLTAQSSGAAARQAFSSADLKTIYAFYNAANQAIGTLREAVKKHAGSRVPIPDYPPNHQEMKELCKRIAEVLK